MRVQLENVKLEYVKRKDAELQDGNWEDGKLVKLEDTKMGDIKLEDVQLEGAPDIEKVFLKLMANERYGTSVDSVTSSIANSATKYVAVVDSTAHIFTYGFCSFENLPAVKLGVAKEYLKYVPLSVSIWGTRKRKSQSSDEEFLGM